MVAPDPKSANDFWDTDGDPWDKYPLTTAIQLASRVNPVRWLVSGVWVSKSAGVIAGKKKAFKTWQMHSLSTAVATGLSYLDHFPVITPGPVIYLTGEGGEDEFKSRHQAIAKRYGLGRNELHDMPFHTMFSVAPLDDSEYLDALRHHLDAVQPVLVVIDPLYAYHPQGIDVSNVYARGQMLAQIRSEIEPYAALIIGDHINKSANDKSLDLDDIGFSGVSQWADSWSLQCHRQDFVTVGPDSFAKLAVEFGSRRTGSMRYNIDWHLTRDMSDPHVVLWAGCDWAVNSAAATGIPVTQVVMSEADCLRAIQADVDASPETNKTNTVGRLSEMYQGRSREGWRALWDTALADGFIVSVKTTAEQPYKKSTRLVHIERFKRGREVGKGGQR